MTYLSSGEEQPHSSSSSPEQQFIPNSSTPESSVPHTVSMGSEMSIDIGNIIKPSKSNDEICLSIRSLSISEKYSLLFQHVKPPTVLPATFSHGCNRKFNNDWLTKYPWLKYSPKLDAVFCGPCAVLLDDSRNNKGVLVNKPFSKWVKMSETLGKHAKHGYHYDCLQAADILKSSIENPGSRIDVMTSQALQSRMTENKQILFQIVRAIIFLGKQGLGLRGDLEDIASEKNPGNFLALLKVFAENDSVLHRHLHQPRAKNVTYLSPKTQNDIIDIIGFDVIRASIITEIQKARYFSIMADEVSSHNVEHMALCVCYVDESCDIQERFMAFLKLQRVRASDITNAIVNTLENLGLSLVNLRGQGYDGTANMSGEKSGVQKQIRDKQPKAMYTHCAGHTLNLAILTSCSVPPVRNCITQIKNLTHWLKASPKREGFLKAIVRKGIQSGVGATRNPILNVCITRWVENIDGWERFCLCHPFLVQLCEAIIYGTAEEGFEDYSDGWTPDDKKDDLAYLKLIKNFEFIYVLVALQRSLLYIKEASVKLQGKEQDITSGLNLIEQCCSELKTLRQKVSDYSARIYAHSSRLAEVSKISISMPRISQRQQHHANQPYQSVEEYFRHSVTSYTFS